MATKRKITEMSVFEFFLCMFVILIHLVSEGVDYYPKWSFGSVLFHSLAKITSFAVPGFVFTSAVKLFYNYSNINNFSYRRFYWGRFKKVVFPYIIVTVIYYCAFIWVIPKIHHFDIKELLGYIISGNLSAQFYFVILIVQFYLLMPVWMVFTRIKSKGFGIALLAISLVLTIVFRMTYPYTDGIVKLFPAYLVFWMVGAYIGPNYERFETLIEKNKLIIYIGWLAFAILHCILSYMQFAGTIAYTFSPIIVVFFCFFSIFGFYTYARELTFSLERRGKGLLTSISQASYDIFLIHCLVIILTQYALTNMEIENILLRFLITGVVTYGFSIIFGVLRTTVVGNFKSKRMRASATRARKKARRKRYL